MHIHGADYTYMHCLYDLFLFVTYMFLFFLLENLFNLFISVGFPLLQTVHFFHRGVCDYNYMLLSRY